MPRGNIPVVQLRRLRGELRHARELAGRTQKQVAEDLGWSLSKVIRQETGAQNISTADVMALMHYYGITDANLVDSLLTITRSKEQMRRWEEYRDLLPKWFMEFLAYEESASRIRQFQSLGVPGLLQTAAYARTLFIGAEESEDTELGLRIRLQRQEILNTAHGREMEFVLDEAIIHRIVGNKHIMLEQLDHLRRLNASQHISIRIVPFAAGAKAAMNGSFAIFDLSDANANGIEHVDVDCVVNIEGLQFETLIDDDPETIGEYVRAFDGIRGMALPEEETNKILEAKIDSFRPERHQQIRGSKLTAT